MNDTERQQPYLCVHTPRKEWRNRLPIKTAVVMANNPTDALKQFVPFHPNDPETQHYNKPYAVYTVQPHFIG
jgi:hypothetical protein